jgi:hypothetical protein
MEDGQALSAWGTGCFRRQLIGSYGIETPFPEAIAKTGAANEENYASGLYYDGIVYVREMEVHQEAVAGVGFSGRVDFFCPFEEFKVRELKSATSEKTFTEVIKRGHYKPNNLAQLVSYMVALEEAKGILHYTYYDKVQGDYIPTAVRAFQVTIDDDGRILVDEEDSEFTVANSLAHRYNSAMWLVDPEVPPLPKGHLDKWKSPCKYCDFRQTCNMYDCGMITTKEEFIQQAAKGVK